MDNDREIFKSGAPESGEEFSLESILAEYKGSAYIDGDKKTPTDILNAKTEEILREVTGRISANEAEGDKPVPVRAVPEQHEVNAAESSDASDFEIELFDAGKPDKSAKNAEPSAGETDSADDDVITDSDTRFFDDFKYADASSTKVFAAEVEEAMASGAASVAAEERRSARGGLFKKRRKSEDDVVPFDTFKQHDYEPEPPEPEPDYAEAAKRFLEPVSILTIKGFAALVISIVMIIFTLLANAEKSLPFGIGTDLALITGVLMILQLIVMMLGIEILISGIEDLVNAEPGVESLIAVSCIITIAGGFIMLLTKDFSSGLPFSAVSAFSLYFAIRGKKMWHGAMFSSLKVSVSVQAPRAVVADDCIADRVVLKKTTCGTEGFYRKLTDADVSENAYAIAAPLLVLASLVFAILASVGRGRPADFSYSFASMIAMTAAFPAAMAYPLPFSLAAISARKSGGAVAGWGGACGIFDSDGALITDDDIFPAGTVTISGVKLFEGVPQDKAIQYASSVIIASDSGISKVFAALLKSQGILARKVEDFTCHDGGGIGGVINSDNVLVGSSAFMNLMSIRVPKGMESRGAVFTAVNNNLIAVFSMSYVPANSVQTALVSMLRTKTGMLFAVKDFNVTPFMIEQKFRVSMDGVELISAADCYRISADTKPENAETLAVVCRDGLGPFADVITKGRMLKVAASIATAVSIVGSAIGVLFMFFMCWKGAFSAASPVNAFIYMMAVQIVVSVTARLTMRDAR